MVDRVLCREEGRPAGFSPWSFGQWWLMGLATPKQTWPWSASGPNGETNLPTQTLEQPSPAGVRAPVVAEKPGNAGGAKGCRKVDVRGLY